jgi:hypothetical protein
VIKRVFKTIQDPALAILFAALSGPLTFHNIHASSGASKFTTSYCLGKRCPYISPVARSFS